MYAVAGVSSAALAGLVALAAVRTVHADARLLRPASSPPAAAAAQNPALASQAAATSPVAAGRRHRLHGLASWYGGFFNGRKTASGERFDMNALTACHPTLPFGSLVKVINRRNHRSVVVRITDRGDLTDEGRIIDLSYGAAQQLAMVQNGLAPVDLQVLWMGHK